MAARRRMAEVGGMLKVTGMRMATPFAPPRPGKTPTMVPTKSPATNTRMLNGVRAIPRPATRLYNASMPPSPPRLEPEEILQPPLGQRDQKELVEHKIAGQGKQDGDGQHGYPAMPSDPPHVYGEVQAGRQVEADELCEEHHDGGGDRHVENRPETTRADEGFVRFALPHLGQDPAQGPQAAHGHTRPQQEDVHAGFRAGRPPSEHAQPPGVVDDQDPEQQEDQGADPVSLAHGPPSTFLGPATAPPGARRAPRPSEGRLLCRRQPAAT